MPRSELEQAVRSLAHHHLLDFALVLHPDFLISRHLEKLAEKLEKIEKGEVKRLMVFMPPRHGKSLLCSQLFPAWYLGRNPNKQIIAASYSTELARDFGRKVRNTLTEQEYKYIFPDVSLAEDSQSIGKFNTNHDGTYVATGIGGSITGRGADVLLIDDVHKDRQEADSEVMRNNVWNWYTSVARTRLMPDGAIIVIMTRWHKDDLAGRLLKAQASGEGEQWEVVSFPALNENNESLWPSRYPDEELLKIKKAIGPREFSCLFQQNPLDSETQVFHSEFFRYYEQLPPKQEGYEQMITMTVDPAFTKRKTSDYSAIVVCAKIIDKTYVLEYVRKRLQPSELIDEILRMYKKWQPYKLGIEAFAAQSVIGFYLQEKAASTGINITYEELKQTDDKITKIKRLEPYIREGKILWKPEMVELERELLEFPQGDHDDLIDALQMSFEFRLFDVPKNDSNAEYFSNLGVHYNGAEPVIL